MIGLVRAVVVCAVGGLLLAVGTPAALAAEPSADMALVNPSDNRDPVQTGDVITYAVGIQNAGPDPATNVRLQVTFPTGLRFEPSRSDANCTGSGTVTCTYTSWPPNATGFPLISATALSAGTYNVVFTISANERDRHLGNNTATETTTVTQAVDADLVLHLSDAEVREGDFFYAVAVSNEGPADATNVVATLQLPAGIEYVSGGCTVSGTTLTCPFHEIGAGRGLASVEQFRATTTGTFTIRGTVIADQPDPNTANNADSGTIVVRPADADLSIDVPESTSTRVNDTFPFPVAVTNEGPAEATNVVATLQLPDDIAYTGGDCSANGQVVTCSFGNVPAGSTESLAPQLRATSAGTFTVSASVDGDQPDPVASNNSDSGSVTADPVADLRVTISESMDPVKPGQGVTYTATITNGGPSPATAVGFYSDWSTTAAQELVVLSWSSSQGTCRQVGVRLDCQLDALGSGEAATVTVSLKTRGKGTATYNAQVGALEFDPDGTDNADTESTTIGGK